MLNFWFQIDLLNTFLRLFSKLTLAVILLQMFKKSFYVVHVQCSVYNICLGPLSAPLCPYCRQRWTLLVPFFSESEHSSADLEEIEQRNRILNYINDFNRRFSGKYCFIYLRSQAQLFWWFVQGSILEFRISWNQYLF